MKEKVGSYKSPVYYFVFDNFPLNANGKIDQRNLHIEMLRRLHKLILEGKLENGIRIISTSVKNSTYSISPVSAMFEEFALNLGFSRQKALKIHQAVEEMLIACVNETAEDVGDIEVMLQCMPDTLRISFTVTEVEETDERKKNYKIASSIILKLVDDWDYKQLDSVRHFVSVDFTYDKDFDIKDFLLQHEPLN